MPCPHETSQADQRLWQGTSMYVNRCPQWEEAVKTKLAAASCTWKFLSKASKLSVVRTALFSPWPLQTNSGLTVEAAGAASLCCCHDTLNGPLWQGPSWQRMWERVGREREEKGWRKREERKERPKGEEVRTEGRERREAGLSLVE